jgi:zinc D-Ala-D-Ala carboxypeptidase
LGEKQGPNEVRLSEHFTLEEMTRSQMAKRHGIDNTPNDIQLENLKTLAKGMESVRSKLDSLPIIVSSGFRCEDLNDLLGSKRTSQHIRGLACDFTCDRYAYVGRVFEVLAESSIEYDQLILEYDSWIHISFPPEGETPRRQTLVINREGTRVYNK